MDEPVAPGKWTVFALVAIGVFMATLDTSIVNISLPSIAAHFQVPVGAAIEWVIIAYLVVVAASMLTAGRLADLVGRKALWLSGLALFTLGSVLCGAAWSMPVLIGFRAVQGLGGALLMAVAPAMVTTAFPPTERGRALGLTALVVGTGVSAGPTIGGVITQTLSWRWIFYVNLPIGIAGIAATSMFLTEHRVPNRGRFDPMGALLLGLGLAGLTGGLSFGGELGWRSPLAILMLGAAVIFLVAMIPYELRHPEPTLDLRLFKSRLFAASTASLILSFLAIFAVGFMMPFYFERLRGFDAERSGLLLTPLPLMFALFAPMGGMLADRVGARWLASLGMTISCAGLVLLSQLGLDNSTADIVWRLMLIGFGQALFQSPNNSALLGAAPSDRVGIASGILATGRVVGQSLSVALAGAVFAGTGGADAAHALHQLGASDPERLVALQQQFTMAFRATLLTCALVAAVGVFTSLIRGSEEDALRRKSIGKVPA